MKNTNDFSKAISTVLATIRREKEAEKIDMELFATNCIKEFNILDFPFYSIKVDETNPDKILIETPFLASCHILIVQYLFGSKEKAAVLFVNGKSVRKIRLQDKNPEYMARIAHALLDYLKRYILLKNKFIS